MPLKAKWLNRKKKDSSVENRVETVQSSNDEIAGKMRLNRAIALAGYGSRRKVEDLIKERRVSVNGAIETNLATYVNLDRDTVDVDGKRLKLKDFAYYLFYKPRGVVTTMSDEKGRECVADLITKLGIKENVKPVGRLDKRSEGLLILTNDGALAAKLTHPSEGVLKHYEVSVDRRISDVDSTEFLNGIELSDGTAKFVSLDLYREHLNSLTYTITVSEGRNRLIRRMLGTRGYKIKRLVRTAIGDIKLTGLRVGEIRKMTEKELAKIRSIK